MVKSSPFKCNFNISDYKHILPPVPKDEEILNVQYDNPEEQYWRRIPEKRDSNNRIIFTPDDFITEMTRIRQGLWIWIKGVPVWIPGDYYFFLQHWNAAGKPPQFRLKRLKAAYHDFQVKNDPRLLGDITFKNRKDGETLYKMATSFMYPIESGMTHGGIGIQSMDLETIQLSCWAVMKAGLAGLNQYFKDYFLKPMGLVSDTEVQTCIRFERDKDPFDPNDYGVGIRMDYKSNKDTSYDSASDLKLINLDEFAKWFLNSIKDTVGVYTPILYPGFERKGLMRLFSSPATTNGRHLDEAHKIWTDSDPNKINPKTGTTFSRLKQNYSNPMDGIESSYDKFGDADPQQIYDFIMGERDGSKGDELRAKIRAYPMPIKGTNTPNEEELFGAYDGGTSIFMNAPGIKKQIVTIKEHQQKLNVFGNLEWPNNVPFSGIPVFRQADIMEFHDHTARWCFTFPNIPRIELLGDIRKPPTEALIQGIIGIDPFNSIYHTKNKDKQSYGAAVGWQFRDFSAFGTNEMPTGAYLARPPHKKIFLDDMVKYCIFTGYKIQHEDLDNDSLFEYFLENEMLDWLLDSRSGKFIETPTGNFKRKGDSGSGRGAKAFTIEIMNLIDGVTNVPVNDNEPYHLLNFNIYQVLEDLLKLDLSDTQHNHLSMALGQALLGRGKLLTRRIIKPSAQMDEAMSVIFS